MMRILGTKKVNTVRSYAGIGSRDTPGEVLHLMAALGRALGMLGWRLQSGNAPGADQYFHKGAVTAARVIQPRIFLPWDGFEGYVHSPEEGIFDATRLEDQWPYAKELAIEARGSEYGLGKGGIALHTRNAFQILDWDLHHPVGAVCFYAEPRSNGRVKGGTNTAVQIAKKFGVERIQNLYFEQERERAKNFVTNVLGENDPLVVNALYGD